MLSIYLSFLLILLFLRPSMEHNLMVSDDVADEGLEAPLTLVPNTLGHVCKVF